MADAAHTELPALPASLIAEQDGPILIIRINRAEKRNSLDDATVLGLETLFRALPPTVKAVVLTGTGDHFSAGLDLSSLTQRDVAAGIAHSRMWHRVFELIQYGPAPVVAVLHGAVVGGGLELACACHVRVAERSTFYALPEGQRGIFVGGGGAMRLPRLIGTARMQDMMLTGRTYGAEEGVTLGFSQYVVDNSAGFAKGMELARKIAGNAPMTNLAVTHVLPRIVESDPASGLMMEALIASIAQADPVAKERLRDFLEKRAPKVSHS